MPTDPVVINDGTANKTYNMVSLSGNEAIYRDVASTLTNPETLRISHDVSKTADGTDRHLIQLARVDDDANGVPYTGTVHIVIAMPREGVAAADMLKEFIKLHTYVTAEWSDLIEGFIP